jgi:CubicO group peptidase (beta-lactamase class C family)
MDSHATRVRAIIACSLLLTCAATLRADDIDTYVSGFIQRHKIPGAAIAVVKNGKLVKAAGYGTASLELTVPATQDTIFEIGSISKQFTAEAIMMLAEEGKLSVDDPIAKYLPESPASWLKITIRQLLTHTSGIPDWEAANLLSYRREYTPKEYIDLIGARPLDFEPGTRWGYTNSSYPLLGIVVERVSGLPFEKFVTERIFIPAGMKTARFKHPEQIVANRAAGYVDTNGELRNGEPLRPGIIAPNGGIMASAPDMAAWDIALHSGRLLKPETIRQMTRIVTLANGRPGVSGMAWFELTFRGHSMLLHNGSTMAGFSAVVYHYTTDDLGIAVLFNIDRWNAVNTVAEHIAGMFVPGASISSLPPRVQDDSARIARFVNFLSDLATGRDPEMLSPDLRGQVSSKRRKSIGEHLKAKQKVTCVDVEDFGPNGQEQLGSLIRWTERYRIDTTNGAVYYTLNLTPDGRVTRFVPEED